MNNKPYLIIGEKKFTMEELYCLLLSPGTKPEEVDDEMLNTLGIDRSMMLCQDVDSGTIQATIQCSSDEYPCVELQLKPKEPGDDTILVARVEEKANDEDEPPKAYLYGRGESYIAIMPVDTRSDAEIDAALEEEGAMLRQDLMVSGDQDQEVHVTFENRFYSADRP